VLCLVCGLVVVGELAYLSDLNEICYWEFLLMKDLPHHTGIRVEVRQSADCSSVSKTLAINMT